MPFRGVDYFCVDSLFSEEELMVRQTARRFAEERVAPIIRDGRRKAVVIISDALRYEVADELRSRIRQEDRFDATLDAVLGVLPSYTQLGMAALLPQRWLCRTRRT